MKANSILELSLWNTHLKKFNSKIRIFSGPIQIQIDLSGDLKRLRWKKWVLKIKITTSFMNTDIKNKILNTTQGSKNISTKILKAIKKSLCWVLFLCIFLSQVLCEVLLIYEYSVCNRFSEFLFSVNRFGENIKILFSCDLWILG